jgi:hypothetical protein
MNDYKLTPEEYRKILDGIDIVTISLIESSAKIDLNEALDPKKEIKINDSMEHDVLNNFINIYKTYSLKANSNNTKKSFLIIKAKFKVVLSSKNEVNEEFIKIYSDISLDLNTWPYFREFVNNTSARMGILPLTLPLLKR